MPAAAETQETCVKRIVSEMGAYAATDIDNVFGPAFLFISTPAPLFARAGATGTKVIDFTKGVEVHAAKLISAIIAECVEKKVVLTGKVNADKAEIEAKIKYLLPFKTYTLPAQFEQLDSYEPEKDFFKQIAINSGLDPNTAKNLMKLIWKAFKHMVVNLFGRKTIDVSDKTLTIKMDLFISTFIGFGLGPEIIVSIISDHGINQGNKEEAKKKKKEPAAVEESK
jgi:uncharacterized protein YajQ (UPF0234 family)